MNLFLARRAVCFQPAWGEFFTPRATTGSKFLPYPRKLSPINAVQIRIMIYDRVVYEYQFMSYDQLTTCLENVSYDLAPLFA